jgi:hypothetical protein
VVTESPCKTPGVHTFLELTECAKHVMATDILGDGMLHMLTLEIQVLPRCRPAIGTEKQAASGGIFYEEGCVIIALLIKQADMTAPENAGQVWANVGETAKNARTSLTTHCGPREMCTRSSKSNYVPPLLPQGPIIRVTRRRRREILSSDSSREWRHHRRPSHHPECPHPRAVFNALHLAPASSVQYATSGASSSGVQRAILPTIDPAQQPGSQRVEVDSDATPQGQIQMATQAPSGAPLETSQDTPARTLPTPVTWDTPQSYAHPVGADVPSTPAPTPPPQYTLTPQRQPRTSAPTPAPTENDATPPAIEEIPPPTSELPTMPTRPVPESSRARTPSAEVVLADEVEGFLGFNDIDEWASQTLRGLPPQLQTQVLQLEIPRTWNASAYLATRMREISESNMQADIAQHKGGAGAPDAPTLTPTQVPTPDPVASISPELAAHRLAESPAPAPGAAAPMTAHQTLAQGSDEMMAVANETPFVPKGEGAGEGRGKGARPVTAGPALRPR